MIRFLDKEREMDLLEQLFDMLRENMDAIAPSGLSFEEEKRLWLSCVRPAMEKAPRQIVLMFEKEKLAGYLQYYVNGGVFMVEEIQIRKDCRASLVFVALWKFMARVIPEDTEVIEAYADRRNLLSQRLIYRLGMEAIGENEDGSCIHFRGSMKHIFGLTEI